MKQDCSDRSDRKHYRETLVVLSLPFNTKVNVFALFIMKFQFVAISQTLKGLVRWCDGAG